jgi:hypothetical protein
MTQRMKFLISDGRHRDQGHVERIEEWIPFNYVEAGCADTKDEREQRRDQNNAILQTAVHAGDSV